MKMQVAKKDLADAIQVVNSSIAGSGTDVSTHFVFRAADGGAEVLTYGGRLFGRAPLKCVVEDTDEADSFTIEGRRLVQWLGAVSDCAVDFRFDPETKIIILTATEGSQEFESLDPKKYPYWDDILTQAKVSGEVVAEDLVTGLAYARQFVSDEETTKPELCVTVAVKGTLFSTDVKAVTLVDVPGIGESKLCLHGSDIPNVSKFLGTCGDQKVEILDHDRASLFRRADGAVLGATRPTVAFPALMVAKEGDDPLWWELSKAEIQRVISFLTAGAAKEDNRLFFTRTGTGPVKIKMFAKTGNKTFQDLQVLSEGSSKVKRGGEEVDPDPVPEKGFMLSHHDLGKVLSNWPEDTVIFGLHIRENKGFVRFRGQRGGVSLLSVLAWLK